MKPNTQSDVAALLAPWKGPYGGLPPLTGISSAAIEDAMARINKAGKAAGILTTDEALAKHYLALGALFVAVGLDTHLLAHHTSALAARASAAIQLYKALGGGWQTAPGPYFGDGSAIHKNPDSEKKTR